MAVTRTFLQTATNTNALTEYTFSTQNFGTATVDRHILCAVVGRIDAVRTLSTVVIGGVSATISVQGSNNAGSQTTLAGFAIAAVPTGTSGDVVVTFSGDFLRCGIALYGLTGVDPIKTDSGASAADDPTYDIDVAAGGAAFAVGYTAQASALNSIVGVTEDYDTLVSVNSAFVGGSDEFATVQTNLTLTIDMTSPLSSEGAFVSYPAAATAGSGVVHHLTTLGVGT